MRTIRGMLVTSVVATGLALAVHAPPASACSCAVVEGPELLGFADVAFTGTLAEMDGPADPTTSMDAVAYAFDVDTVYKGTADADTLVYTANNSASCGLEGLTVGARYVVFATRIATGEEADVLPGSQVGALTSGLCSGTAELGADGPPAFLGSGRPPAGEAVETPAGAPSAADGDGGGVPVVPIAIGVLAVGGAGAAALAFTRRRRAAS